MDLYVFGGKFNWDDLLIKGEVALQRVREQWRKNKDVPNFVLGWIAAPVRTDDGGTITELIVLPVPKGRDVRAAVLELVKRANPYALLVIERKENAVTVILESHHGARCWSMAICRHGDRWVLEKEVRLRDADCLGVLWQQTTN